MTLYYIFKLWILNDTGYACQHGGMENIRMHSCLENWFYIYRAYGKWWKGSLSFSFSMQNVCCAPSGGRTARPIGNCLSFPTPVSEGMENSYFYSLKSYYRDLLAKQANGINRTHSFFSLRGAQKKNAPQLIVMQNYMSKRA